MIASKLQGLTFNYLLQTALDKANDKVDKRQGSIIYDSLASICYLLSTDVIDALLQSYIDNYVGMASNDNLDRLLELFGITRISATYSSVKVEFYDSNDNLTNVPIGTVFTTADAQIQTSFKVVEEYESSGVPVTGTYIADCQSLGTVGNSYIGECYLVSSIQGISRVVITNIINYARDEETDDELRERVKDKVKYKSWAGNIQSYKDWLTNGTLNNVGQMQVYPIWNGPGTVKLSLVDLNNRPIEQEVLTELLDYLAPMVNGTRIKGNGFVPIDCLLTLDTPEYYNISIEMNITIDAGHQEQTIKNNIINMLSNYISELNGLWGDGVDPYSTTIQVAVIGSRTLAVDGVADIDVASIKINNSTGNKTINHNSDHQYILSISPSDIIINIQ